MQEQTQAPPLPPRVHGFIVRIADRGPSTRALVTMLVGGALMAGVLLFALPKPKHDTLIVTPDAPPHASVPEARVPPQAEPVPPVTTGQIGPSTKVAPAATVTAVAASPSPRIDTPRADTAPALAPVADSPRIENVRADTAPRVIDLTRTETPPLAPNARAAADLIVAPAAPSRDRESLPLPLATREDLTPRPPRREERSVERPAVGATEQPAPVRTAEPEPRQTNE